MKSAVYFLITLLSLNAGAINAEINDPIEISGDYYREESGADKLKKMRSKLEKQNQEMIHQKVEKLRYQQELELTKKLQKRMNNVMQNLNNI